MFNDQIRIKLIGEKQEVIIQKNVELPNLYPNNYEIEDSESQKLLEWLVEGTEGIFISVLPWHRRGPIKLGLNRSSILYTVIE